MLERQAWRSSRHCPSILAPRFSSSETHGFSPSPLVALLCTLHVMAAVSPNLQLPKPFIFNIHYPLAIYICVYVYTVHQLYAYAVYKLCIWYSIYKLNPEYAYNSSKFQELHSGQLSITFEPDFHSHVVGGQSNLWPGRATNIKWGHLGQSGR